jgi:predicted aspartyl protease
MGEISQSVLVNGVRVKALIDSGATDNYLSKRVSDKVRLFLGKSSFFETIDGEHFKGKVAHVTVKVFNRLGSCEVVVTDILPRDGYDLVLGQSFLQDNEVSLDFEKDMMKYSGHQPKIRRIGRL